MPSEPAYFTLKLATALGCSLVAGIFFAFSTFVMRALAQLPLAQGIAAMQAINITVINPWFMTVFIGTAIACVYLAARALYTWQQPGAAYLLAGSLLYLVSTFLVTIAENVPLNNALAEVSPSTPEAARVWTNYLTYWPLWNHIRTAAALAAATALTLALRG
ncbi:MAG TPA: anthrone oxygenase family protein [Trichocoleus sp.]